MMMRARLSSCVFLLALSSPLFAMNTDMPARGMSMGDVVKKFGAPVKKNAAIGRPPITRWEYNGYVVVFEYSTVVQSVALQTAPVATSTVTITSAPAKPDSPPISQAERDRRARERADMANARGANNDDDAQADDAQADANASAADAANTATPASAPASILVTPPAGAEQPAARQP
jgi:hypothetical protein